MNELDLKSISDALSRKAKVSISFEHDRTNHERVSFFFADIAVPNTFYFDLTLGWQNFTIVARPGPYGGALLKAMRKNGADDSSVFMRIYSAITATNERNEILVNGKNADVSTASIWLDEWSMFEWTIESKVGQFSGKSPSEKLEVITETLLRCIGAMVSLMPIQGSGSNEGAVIVRTIVEYERDEGLRSDCLSLYGYLCQVCNFDFEKFYGTTGKGYIEVHHLERLADRKLSMTNPITDLLPLCANCHRIAHRRNPPYRPDEIRLMIEVERGRI